MVATGRIAAAEQTFLIGHTFVLIPHCTSVYFSKDNGLARASHKSASSRKGSAPCGSPARNLARLQRVQTRQHKSHCICLRSIHSVDSTGCQFSGVQVQVYFSCFQRYAMHILISHIICLVSLFLAVLVVFSGHFSLLRS